MPDCEPTSRWNGLRFPGNIRLVRAVVNYTEFSCPMLAILERLVEYMVGKVYVRHSPEILQYRIDDPYLSLPKSLSACALDFFLLVACTANKCCGMDLPWP